MRQSDYIGVTLLSAATALFSIPILLHVDMLPVKLNVLTVAVGIVCLVVLENLALFVCGILARKLPLMLKLARFSSVGVFNTILDTSILNILTYFFVIYAGPLVVLFNIISFSTTVVTSYFINRSWSFETSMRPGTKEFSLFVAVVLSALAINSLIIYYLTTVLGAPAGISPALWITISKLITAAVSLVWNFTGMHFIVFRHRPQSDVEAL